MDRIGNGGTKVRAIFVPRGHPMWVGSITTFNRRCESGRGETTMTRRESWAMLKTLQAFNERLEALALEVTGLRVIVNMQSKQLATVQAARPVTRYTTTPTAPIALATSRGSSGARCHNTPPSIPAGTTTRFRME